MVAMLAVPMIGAVALATDASIWMLEQHRLQIAADAAAYAAALQLQNTAMHVGAPNSYVTLVTNEANAATGGSLTGAMGTPVVAIASDYSSVTVTLSSVADTYFVQVVNKAAATLQATATAGLLPGSPCVLALNGTIPSALSVGGTYGSGSIVAVGCGVFSNSVSTSALSLNSGSIVASTIGTHGGVALAGIDITIPAPTPNAAQQADPDASKWTLPTAAACTPALTNVTDNYYKSTPFALAGGTYCGTTTIGGNGSTAAFAPGVYIFTGNVVIQNIAVSIGAGVTFIMMGATPSTPAGSFTWQNNSAATLTAPPLLPVSATGGLLFWQACPNTATAGSNVNGAIIFDGGSALIASGAIYAPCGAIQMSDAAVIAAAPLSSLSVIASKITVESAASLQLLLTTGSGGSSQIALLQ